MNDIVCAFHRNTRINNRGECPDCVFEESMRGNRYE